MSQCTGFRRWAFYTLTALSLWIGWGIRGSISYMQVIAYTHSGHSPSVLYGFACLFVIGFLWAAMGGAGTALPAVADRPLLEGLFTPIRSRIDTQIGGGHKRL